MIPKQRRLEIDEIIENKINLPIGQYPDIDILSISKEYGITVKKGNNLPNNVRGLIVYGENPEIIFKRSQSGERNTFTLAHELGHFLLHNEDKEAKYYLDKFHYNNDENSKEESEANYFAVSLLVPKDRLIELRNTKRWKYEIIPVYPNIACVRGYYNTEDMANYFGVTQAVVSTRINFLKNN